MLADDFFLSENEADLYVINACTVTSLAEAKARKVARQLRRKHPRAKITLIGCLAEAVAQGNSSFGNADLFGGNGWKENIKQFVAQALAGKQGQIHHLNQTGHIQQSISTQANRVRAFVKIQDGCSRSCTYCRITQVRGSVRSKPQQHVVNEVKRLVDNGHPEVILTGINIAQYGSGRNDLPQLVEKLLEIGQLRRLRLASIDPDGISDALIEAFANDPRACPHFHIPLQSGDDRVLRSMARGYDSSVYLSKVTKILETIPEATFGTDIMVGFPGEDERAISSTCSIIKQVGFGNLHIFRFSPRKGTAAATFSSQVPEKTKKKRADRVDRIGCTARRKLFDGLIGTRQKVLIEERRNGRWRGYTCGYVDLHLDEERALTAGQEVATIVTSANVDHIEGVNTD